MKSPYTLSRSALEAFMSYHGIKNLQQVAEMFGMSSAYLSQILSGSRPLNEHLRGRIQVITRLPQDKLFELNPDDVRQSHQSTAFPKYFGMVPYKPDSKAQAARDFTKNKPRARWDMAQELRDGRADYLKYARK